MDDEWGLCGFGAEDALPLLAEVGTLPSGHFSARFLDMCDRILPACLAVMVCVCGRRDRRLTGKGAQGVAMLRGEGGHAPSRAKVAAYVRRILNAI